MKKFNYIFLILSVFLIWNCKENSNLNTATEQKNDPQPEAVKGPDSSQDLKWLQGSWLNEDKTTIETWAIQGDSLSGNVFSSAAQKITEVLSIKKVNDTWSYAARVLDQNSGNTIQFTMTKYTSGEIAFENSKHDFPNRLSYTQMDEKTIMVNISGNNNPTVEYKMFKLD
ncbi:MAG: hypothetical protein IPN49_14740 [Saprospiraceae bacterium]|jgi:hypothetical protein|nr:hypothetical protein [Saprospiraceae bacterium]MBK6564513.1 hypothetical protein [Saprospiraceae bacterium]MBK7523149.1 hypothetical protein [Saprospiraceae bacterium]MBK8371856.1 hypothetical protein [Saprospiraceae bacterium]MBK8820277.1 hypothetical protein [Saprospiraceae bacterium]